jgi:hypothetical protein
VDTPNLVILSSREAACRRTHFAAAASFDTRLEGAAQDDAGLGAAEKSKAFN